MKRLRQRREAVASASNIGRALGVVHFREKSAAPRAKRTFGNI